MPEVYQHSSGMSMAGSTAAVLTYHLHAISIAAYWHRDERRRNEFYHVQTREKHGSHSNRTWNNRRNSHGIFVRPSCRNRVRHHSKMAEKRLVGLAQHGRSGPTWGRDFRSGLLCCMMKGYRESGIQPLSNRRPLGNTVLRRQADKKLLVRRFWTVLNFSCQAAMNGTSSYYLKKSGMTA